MGSGVTTSIASARAEGVTIRGLDLVDDIIGKLSFTEMTYFLCAGVLPDPAQTRVLDACLVTLMLPGMLLQPGPATDSISMADRAATSFGQAVQICVDLQERARTNDTPAKTV